MVENATEKASRDVSNATPACAERKRGWEMLVSRFGGEKRNRYKDSQDPAICKQLFKCYCIVKRYFQKLAEPARRLRSQESFHRGSTRHAVNRQKGFFLKKRCEYICILTKNQAFRVYKASSAVCKHVCLVSFNCAARLSAFQSKCSGQLPLVSLSIVTYDIVIVLFSE